MASKRKRSVADEKRVFKLKWEMDYFMIETAGHAMKCLICSQILKTVKSDNARQHFSRHASHSYAKLDGESRKNCVAQLKKLCQQETACLSTFIRHDKDRINASYKVVYNLGVAGMSYSSGPVIKQCILDAVKCIHPGKEDFYSSIALSRDTVQRRLSDIAHQQKLSLQEKVQMERTLFAIAIDESTDVSDLAQLVIFIRSLSAQFDVSEDLLSMQTLATHTRGEDIFIAVKDACVRSGLDLKNLRGICTDGAAAMTGSRQGFVARFSKYLSDEFGNDQLINLHCIIHQEALCAKSIQLDTVLKDVNRIILFIRANALNHRQFYEILHSSESSAEDVLYHSQVRWLSQGETSRRVLMLRKEIAEFYEKKDKECLLLDKQFLASLAFLVDVLSHVNHLNRSLQGKLSNICSLYRSVTNFGSKCDLLKSHLSQQNLYHFQQLNKLVEDKEIELGEIPFDRFTIVMEELQLEFGRRFKDFEKISDKIRLVSCPHLFDVERAPLHVQMELVELKNDEVNVAKFERGENLIDVWRDAYQYPELQNLARNTLVIFGSTYLCESAFSRMKFLKSKYRTRLTNSNLESQLRIMISSETPDFASLVAGKQDHRSH